MKKFGLYAVLLIVSAQVIAAKDTPTNAAPANTNSKNANKQEQANAYVQGYEAGQVQYRAMIDDLQAQTAELRKELDFADRELEGQRHENDIFLKLYGAFSVLLVGGGLFSLVKQNSQAKETQREAREFVRKAELSARMANRKANLASTRAEQAAAEFAEVHRAKEAMFEELPRYLEQVFQEADLLNPKDLDPHYQALIHSVDHFTFLNFWFRFGEPQTKDLENYCRALEATVKAHLANGRPAEALDRIHFYFRLVRSQNMSSQTRTAYMYGYRARAFLQLLGREQRSLPLGLPGTVRKIEEYREQIKDNIYKSKQQDASWSYPHFLAAFFCALYPCPPNVSDPLEQKKIRLAGQIEAVRLYRDLIADAALKPNMRTPSVINLCCCLKRVADETGDFDLLFKELEGLPTASEIRAQHAAVAEDQRLGDLWTEIMKESVFFQSAVPHLEQYKNRWIKLLENKVNVTNWREQYGYFSQLNPEMQHWEIKPWTH